MTLRAEVEAALVNLQDVENALCDIEEVGGFSITVDPVRWAACLRGWLETCRGKMSAAIQLDTEQVAPSELDAHIRQWHLAGAGWEVTEMAALIERLIAAREQAQRAEGPVRESWTLRRGGRNNGEGVVHLTEAEAHRCLQVLDQDRRQRNAPLPRAEEGHHERRSPDGDGQVIEKPTRDGTSRNSSDSDDVGLGTALEGWDRSAPAPPTSTRHVPESAAGSEPADVHQSRAEEGPPK